MRALVDAVKRTPLVDPPPPGCRWGLPWEGEPRVVRLPPLDRDLMVRIRPVALYVREAVQELPTSMWFDAATMQGACAMVSYALTLALRRLGIPAVFVLRQHRASGGIDHAWVEVGELVVDATATQFGARERVHFARVGHVTKYIYLSTHRGRAALAVVKAWGHCGHREKEDGYRLPSRAQLRRVAAKAGRIFRRPAGSDT